MLGPQWALPSGLELPHLCNLKTTHSAPTWGESSNSPSPFPFPPGHAPGLHFPGSLAVGYSHVTGSWPVDVGRGHGPGHQFPEYPIPLAPGGQPCPERPRKSSVVGGKVSMGLGPAIFPKILPALISAQWGLIQGSFWDPVRKGSFLSLCQLGRTLSPRLSDCPAMHSQNQLPLLILRMTLQRTGQSHG